MGQNEDKMKKLIILSMAVLFMTAGCEESEKQVAKEAPAAAPVQQAQTVAPAEPAAPAAPQATIVNVDWNKALEMQKAGAFLVDVRTPAEVAEGMAPGAANIPLQEITQRLAEFPKDKDVVVYCRSGKRSMAASQFLIDNGYEHVFNVVGGFLAFPAK